jgi:hypothetical protein
MPLAAQTAAQLRLGSATTAWFVTIRAMDEAAVTNGRPFSLLGLMTEQDRLRILYLLTLRDIDHARRPAVHVARYLVPVPMLLIVMTVLTTVLDLSATQASALLLATVPASVFAYVGWNNTHDDRVEAMEYRAAELRLQIQDDAPIAAGVYNAATAIDEAIRAAQRRAAVTDSLEGNDRELDLGAADERETL